MTTQQTSNQTEGIAVVRCNTEPSHPCRIYAICEDEDEASAKLRALNKELGTSSHFFATLRATAFPVNCKIGEEYPLPWDR